MSAVAVIGSPFRIWAIGPVALVVLIAGLTAIPACLAQELRSSAVSTFDWSRRQWEVAVEASSQTATPSHIDRAIQDLIAEIGILRDELGIYDYPPQGELQDDRAPVHVYAKSQELLAKVRRIQNRFGVPVADFGPIPFKDIVRDDVLDSVVLLLDEVRTIKAQLAIRRDVEPTRLVPGKSPRDVYGSLTTASRLLDGLLGQSLTPDDVYENASFAAAEIEVIAAGLGVSIESELPAIKEAKRPLDVTRLVLSATRQAVNLERKLGMDASSMPNLTLVRVTPSEAYDATNALLAEIARIKFYAGIDVRRADPPTPNGKKPQDVFAVVSLIADNLDRLSEAATQELSIQLKERMDALQRERGEREAERQRQVEAERQRELERQRQVEAERQRELERRRQAEAERQRELERQRQAEAERQRQVEEERQRELERVAAEQQVAEDGVGSSEGDPEQTDLPPCRLLIAENLNELIPGYPGRGRKDYGDAVVRVRFTVDESGETIDDEVSVDLENSSAERERSFDRFAEIALNAVRVWRLEFADPNDTTCRKSQTRSIAIRFNID